MSARGDAAIGVAFRRSLFVVLLLACIVGAVMLVRSAVPTTPPAVDPAPDASVRLPSDASDERNAVLRLAAVDAAETGISFIHRSGARGERLLPETLGGGVAAIDLDGDDDADLVFVDGISDAADGTHALRALVRVFRNDGGFRFTALPEAIVDETRWATRRHGMGVAVGDVNDDGRPDLAITAVGGVSLLVNESTDADGIRLRDRSVASGLDSLAGRSWWTCAAFAPIDDDATPDLVLARYVEWSPEIDARVAYELSGVGRAYGPPTGFAATEPLIVSARGDGSFLVEAPIVLPLAPDGRAVAKTLGMLAGDFDGDDRADVFLANDTTPNQLFRRDDSGEWVEDGAARGVAYDLAGSPTGAMGVDVGWMRDGADLAIAVGNFANEPASFFVARDAARSDAPSRFLDDAASAGLVATTRRALAFGVRFADLDRDGIEELVFANGHIEPEIARVQASQSHRQAASVFARIDPNDGGAAYRPVPRELLGGLGTPIVGRGLASADFDLDGDEDLVLTQIDGPPLLVRNDAPPREPVLRVRVRGPKGNRLALGAVVDLVVGGPDDPGDSGVRRRAVLSSRSYLSAPELALTLGPIPGRPGEDRRATAIVVRFPDGTTVRVELPIASPSVMNSDGVSPDAGNRAAESGVLSVVVGHDGSLRVRE